MTTYKNFASEIASYILIALFLWLALTHGLLAPLLTGLLVYSLVAIFSPRLEQRVGNDRARMIMVGIIGTAVISLLILIVWGAVAFFKSDNGNAQVLLQKLADIIDASRAQCPTWICENF